MARYTPDFLASVQHDVEETDMPLPAIAKKHGISKRTLYRLSHRQCWQKRSERLHDLPPAARLLGEATALLTERGKADAADIDVGRAKRSVPATPSPGAQAADAVDVGTARSAPLPTLPTRRATAQTGPSSTDLGSTRDRTSNAQVGQGRLAMARDLRSLAPQDDGDGSGNAHVPSTSSAIDRLERLVEKELDAEEAVRAQLGPLPRNPADAERTARTLSTLTQTLHALQRLRSGLGFQSHDDDDDMPRDIDEFRRDLARRIDAFVASRTQRADAGGDPESDAVDAVRQGLCPSGACAPGPAGTRQ